MDEKVIEFEKWFMSKKDEWSQKGIRVLESGLISKYGHQYWIKLESDYGLGNIVLYESNGYYWVDFEAGNYDYDVMFIEAGIDFENADSISECEKKFVEHLIWRGEI